MISVLHVDDAEAASKITNYLLKESGLDPCDPAYRLAEMLTAKSLGSDAQPYVILDVGQFLAFLTQKAADPDVAGEALRQVLVSRGLIFPTTQL